MKRALENVADILEDQCELIRNNLDDLKSSKTKSALEQLKIMKNTISTIIRLEIKKYS